jgi:hypothetical protein
MQDPDVSSERPQAIKKMVETRMVYIFYMSKFDQGTFVKKFVDKTFRRSESRLTDLGSG